LKQRLQQKSPQQLQQRKQQSHKSINGMSMYIKRDDLTHPAVLRLLNEHLEDMYAISPPESVHALDVSKLKVPSISFWTIWSDEQTLLGCGALKELDATHGEVKSMRTPKALRGRGAGRLILTHIIAEARQRGYARLSLETGPAATFAAAHKLYVSAGFRHCGPFGDYGLDPHSVFMTLEL
jgi:putative acetyltransferase